MNSREQLIYWINKGVPKDRFEDLIDKTSGSCWIWKGKLSHNGYGVIHPGQAHSIRAHVYSYCLSNKILDENHVVRHKCNNAACVNPEHLLEGTQKDNAQDRILSGRGRKKRDLTHCVNGHEYKEGNYWVNAKGFKICKTCNRMKVSSNVNSFAFR